MVRMPARQVHLDFHTSEHIPGVGSRFDKAQFQEALRLGSLSSITVFAKCHHAWSYYPTRVGRIHPTMDPSFDLTGAMIDAAHEIGVRAPVYYTVGWAVNDTEAHPEWACRNIDGSMATTGNYDLTAAADTPKPTFSWIFMCPSGGYLEHMLAATREICERYPVFDGMFYDICFGPFTTRACYCENCVKGMKAEGIDINDEAAAIAYNNRKWLHFCNSCNALIHSLHPEATAFYNSGAGLYNRYMHGIQTHYELEDLPTTWGGYDKMPTRAKFMQRYGKDYLGMTGKFHTAWGEFGGFKNAEAMRFECASMLAFGARCSIGDQMPPDGAMDLETYRLIGHAYRYVEALEPWAFDTKETTRLGVYLSGDPQADEGLHRMLLEKQLDFDVLLPEDDPSRFDALILPDKVLLTEAEAARINSSGCAVLMTGQSGLDTTKTRFLLDAGVAYVAPGAHDIDYLRALSPLNDGWVTAPFLCYTPAHITRVVDGEVLAAVREPFFSRTYGRFCSHQYTAYRPEDAAHPGAARKGKTVYLAHELCGMYYRDGAQIHRDTLLNALKLIYDRPVLRVKLFSQGRARLTDQTGKNRYVLHLLYGAPISRGRTSVIEDLPPILNVSVEADLARPIKRVYLAPQMTELPFEQTGETVKICVPKVECHQAVVFDY